MAASGIRHILRTLLAHFELSIQVVGLLDTQRSLLIWTSRVPKPVDTGEFVFLLPWTLTDAIFLAQIVESVLNRLIIIDPGMIIGSNIWLATV